MGKVFVQVSDFDLVKVLASVREGANVVVQDGDRTVATVTRPGGIPEEELSALKARAVTAGGAPGDNPPAEPARRRRPRFGSLKGKIHLDDSFWDPLPEDERRLWNGEGD